MWTNVCRVSKTLSRWHGSCAARAPGIAPDSFLLELRWTRLPMQKRQKYSRKWFQQRQKQNKFHCVLRVLCGRVPKCEEDSKNGPHEHTALDHVKGEAHPRGCTGKEHLRRAGAAPVRAGLHAVGGPVLRRRCGHRRSHPRAGAQGG